MGRNVKVIKPSFENEEISLNQAFLEYIEEKQVENLSPKSIISYENIYHIFSKDMDVTDEIVANDIDVQVIHNWIRILKKRVKDVTVNSYLSDIRGFFYWCMNDERKYITPKFKIPYVKFQEAPPKHYNSDEIEALLKKPLKTDSFGDWRNWAIVYFIMGTGARASTVCSTKIEDIDFINKGISYEHTKNNKSLVIPLSSELEKVLKEYIKIWRSNAKPSELLFPSVSNTPYNAKMLWNSMKKYFNKRGIEKTTIHGLRHTFAINWVRNNGNVFILQRILGHATLEMTKKYVNLYGEDLREEYSIYNPLDTMFKSKGNRNKITRSN